MTLLHPQTRHTRRGFNLVEAAIVLGVVGLVIGGIWVAAATVQANMRKSDASKALVLILQNVRTLYAGQSPPVADITTTMINANLVPSNMIQGTLIKNPWGGNITVLLLASAGVIADQIGVMYDNIPRDACIELSSKNTNLASSTGLSYMLINNSTTTVTVVTFPYLPTTAATDCQSNNTIFWGYSGIN